VREWPMAFRHGVVVGVETVEEWRGTGDDRELVQVRKVKLTDRIKHLELIGRHVGVQAFKERLEHSGPGGGPIPMAAVSMSPDEFRTLALEMARKV
jgi:phage terminase small subunit